MSIKIQQANQRGDIDQCPTQIPIKAKTSNLYVIPIDVYVGMRANHDIGRDGRYRGVPVSSSVIVSVRAADITAEWMLLQTERYSLKK